MREAGENWNGLSLVHPPVEYTNWDADKIQGCICDAGWGGYDCGFRTCPWGRDPLDTKPFRDEKFVIACQATSGFFTLQLHGGYTPDIPYNADAAFLKMAIESITGVGRVDVRMQAEPLDGLPAVCGHSAPLFTSFWLRDQPGALPPVRVLNNASSSSRMWPNGGAGLASSTSSSAFLQMATRYYLRCPKCATNCNGVIYFTYRDSVSTSVDVTVSGGIHLIAAALRNLANLTSDGWSITSINASSSTGYTWICSNTSSQVVTITLFSSFGNIPDIGLIDSTFSQAKNYVALGFGNNQKANVTLTSQRGNGTLYECSNQGVCDNKVGACVCTNKQSNQGSTAFVATSSDGRGNFGTRGDCGHVRKNNVPCEAFNFCSGHGVCRNATNDPTSFVSSFSSNARASFCTCYDGWHGASCSIKACPRGRALFDEPTDSTHAHALKECSGQGLCLRDTGTCVCRDGFVGPDCSKKDCLRDATTGEPCNGHGFCENLNSIFNEFGLSYGDPSWHAPTEQPQAWDAYSWYECVCSNKLSDADATSSGGGYLFGHPKHPSAGPGGRISGIAPGSLPMPGWGGWDCSKRMCPRGDSTDRGNAHKGVTVKEVQRVVCRESPKQDVNNYGGGFGNGSFSLDFYGASTALIYPSYKAKAIKAAIEYASTIGNVTITFPNFKYDNISTACHPHMNNTGFYVTFDTEGGALPLMAKTPGDNATSSAINVYEVTKGNSLNLECGGPQMGYCDRDAGLCMCRPHQGSSNGTNAYGPNGDCGFYSSAPWWAEVEAFGTSFANNILPQDSSSSDSSSASSTTSGRFSYTIF